MKAHRRWPWVALLVATAAIVGGVVARGESRASGIATSAAATTAVATITNAPTARPDLESCRSRMACGAPIKGGIRITFTGWSCSTGFVARDATNGKHYVVTAGHCVTGSGLFAQWSHAGVPVGHAALDAFRDGTSADAGAIDIEDRDAGNEIYGASSVDIQHIATALRDSQQTVGSQICRSGATSGWTCGHIVTADEDATVAGRLVHHTWWTDFPSAEGDSGAAIVDPQGHLLGIAIATTPTQTLYSTVDGIAAELKVRPCATSPCD